MRGAALVISLLSTSCALSMTFDGYGATPEGTTDAHASPTGDGRPITIDAHAADVAVVFHGADGKVLDVARTGADGKASSTVDATMVTVATSNGNLLTYTSIGHGDTISLPGPRPHAKVLGTIRVRLPEIAADYKYYGAKSWGGPVDDEYGCCGWRGTVDTTPIVDLSFSDDLLARDGTLTVLARASTSNTTPPSVQCLVATGIKPSTVLPGEEQSLSNAVWQAPPVVVLHAATTDSRTVTAGYSLVAMRDDLQGDASCIWPVLATEDQPGSNETETGRFHLSPELAGDTLATASVADGPRFSTIRRRGSIDTSVVELVVPPSPITGGIDSASSGAKRIRWDGVPESAVGTLMTLSYFRWGFTEEQWNGPSLKWTFIEPPSTRERIIPDLPPDLASAFVENRTTFQDPANVAVEVYLAGVISDFDGFRQWWTAGSPTPANTEIVSIALTVKSWRPIVSP